MAKQRRATKKPGRDKKPVPATDAIRRLDVQFVRAANAKAVDSLVAGFYAEDAVVMPPNHPIVEGRDKIRTFFRGLIDSGFSSISLETTTVESVGNLAYGRGRYTLSMSPPGGSPVRDVGKYIVVYRRRADGSWRAAADIFNSDQASR